MTPENHPRVVIVGAGYRRPRLRPGAGRQAGQGHDRRPAELSPVRAAALPGRHCRAVAGGHRAADPAHSRPLHQYRGRARHRDRRRHGGATRAPRQWRASLPTTSSWSRPARTIPISAIRNGRSSRPGCTDAGGRAPYPCTVCSIAFERAEASRDPARQDALMTTVIVGGGPTGVEMAGAVAELARHALARDFRIIDPRHAKIVLIEAGLQDSFELSREAFGLCQGGAGAAWRHRHRQRGGRVDRRHRRRGCGPRIEAGTVIWGAGIKASPAAGWLGARSTAPRRVRSIRTCR